MGVFVIAEAGVNHNGDRDLAFGLVDAAAGAGADAVKFQTFRADDLAAADAPKAAYQKTGTDADESQLDMLRRLELSPDIHRNLMDRCRDRGIAFLSTPFDQDSLDFLTGTLGLDTVKLPSGEITNGPLLLAAARAARRIILSTGMSTMDEVADAVGVLAFGFVGDGAPARDAFRAALTSPDGTAAVRDRVTLLHCTTEYPAPADEANLRAMDALRDRFGTDVGLSDHTQGIAVAIAAAARGAAVVEKHVTLDRGLPGPDHAASLEPNEFKDMVAGIRMVEQALGDGQKRPMPSELGNRDVARKSLVAARAIARDQVIGPDDLTARRPGGGTSPMTFWDWVGRVAERDIPAGGPVP